MATKRVGPALEEGGASAYAMQPESVDVRGPSVLLVGKLDYQFYDVTHRSIEHVTPEAAAVRVEEARLMYAVPAEERTKQAAEETRRAAEETKRAQEETRRARQETRRAEEETRRAEEETKRKKEETAQFTRLCAVVCVAIVVAAIQTSAAWAIAAIVSVLAGADYLKNRLTKRPPSLPSGPGNPQLPPGGDTA